MFSQLRGAASRKMVVFLTAGIVVTILSLFIIWDINAHYGIIFSAILIGICDSGLIALSLTLPQ